MSRFSSQILKRLNQSTLLRSESDSDFDTESDTKSMISTENTLPRTANTLPRTANPRIRRWEKKK